MNSRRRVSAALIFLFLLVVGVWLAQHCHVFAGLLALLVPALRYTAAPPVR